MSPQEYIIEYFVSKDLHQIISKKDILAFNYMDTAFFSSIEFIEMISHFEDYFSIQFLDQHLKSEAFYKIGTLCEMITSLIQEEQLC